MAENIQVSILAFQEDAGGAFLQTVCGPDARSATQDEKTLHFDLHAQDPARPPLEGLDLRLVNGVVVLVRFLDSVSMEQVKALHHALPSHTVLPQVVVIFREAGESEFKMSCASCGQKLWVRDSDAGRSGRCPHCRKIFILPTQSGILKSYLMLTEATPVLQVIKGKAATGRAVVTALLDRVKAVSEAMKSQTMRVQIPVDESGKA